MYLFPTMTAGQRVLAQAAVLCTMARTPEGESTNGIPSGILVAFFRSFAQANTRDYHGLLGDPLLQCARVLRHRTHLGAKPVGKSPVLDPTPRNGFIKSRETPGGGVDLILFFCTETFLMQPTKSSSA